MCVCTSRKKDAKLPEREHLVHLRQVLQEARVERKGIRRLRVDEGHPELGHELKGVDGALRPGDGRGELDGRVARRRARRIRAEKMVP